MCFRYHLLKAGPDVRPARVVDYRVQAAVHRLCRKVPVKDQRQAGRYCRV